MRRALFILLVALGGFLTAFIGGSAVAGALELPHTGLVENLTGTVHQDQTGTVDNQTDQTSEAGVDNQQSNVYAPISILSPSSGDNHVEQGNQADNSAGSVVVNGTDQSLNQGQTGTATTTDDSRDDSRDGGWDKGSKDAKGSQGQDEGGSAAVDQSQTGTVANATEQSSKAGVENRQTNVYAPISILSPSSGDNHVEQGNQADNSAVSGVGNGTGQSLNQGQTGTATTTDNSHDEGRRDGGWNGGPVLMSSPEGNGSGNGATVDQNQAGTVENSTEQTSKAEVDNRQDNTYIPLSFLSPTSGDNEVRQGNQADNEAVSVVSNGTGQSLNQGQTGTATTTDNSRTEGGWDNGWNPAPVRSVQGPQGPQGPHGSEGSNAADVHQNQAGTVKNSTEQKSKAEVENRQKNTFIPLSFLSPTSGDNSVRQGNQAHNEAGSIVSNGTSQALNQHQTGTATATDDSRLHGGWSPWNWNHHDDCTCGSMWNHPGQWEQHAPR